MKKVYWKQNLLKTKLPYNKFIILRTNFILIQNNSLLDNVLFETSWTKVKYVEMKNCVIPFIAMIFHQLSVNSLCVSLSFPFIVLHLIFQQLNNILYLEDISLMKWNYKII